MKGNKESKENEIERVKVNIRVEPLLLREKAIEESVDT